jgi:hypothetical protein
LPAAFKNNKLIAQTSSGGRAPDVGASYVYPSANGGRYTRQTMRWGNFPGFRYEETYEHDFFLYNYDRATYLDPRNIGYPNCLPAATYWSTTWPASSRPYLDTRFGQNSKCEVDELAYTVGAAFANQLFNGITYETYIRTANGNANSDRFRLSGQIGYRSPVTNCPRDWTWCSFGKYSVVLVPAWSVNVPNTRSWVK